VTPPGSVADSALVAALRVQEAAWNERPLVRALYVDWFRELVVRLSSAQGASVELGAGIARLQEIAPWIVPTDVERTPWTQTLVDAESLPFSSASVANLVLVDVFHHLARPARFLDEAVRALVPQGRIVVLDPYCSPVSTLAYRLFHHERTDLSVDAFAEDAGADEPLDSNQARATLAFFRARAELRRRWPELVLVEAHRLALLAYPLSGGFTGPRLLGHRPGTAVLRLERRLTRLAPLLAFRCLVVLERRAS
jgi:SAM-dependent methyltransferase